MPAPSRLALGLRRIPSYSCPAMGRRGVALQDRFLEPASHFLPKFESKRVRAT